LNYQDASIRMTQWITYYNCERLHSAIWYLTPNDVFYGMLAERKEKPYTVFIKRQEYWRMRNTASLYTLCLP
jgi:hypothetical protein